MYNRALATFSVALSLSLVSIMSAHSAKADETKAGAEGTTKAGAATGSHQASTPAAKGYTLPAGWYTNTSTGVGTPVAPGKTDAKTAGAGTTGATAPQPDDKSQGAADDKGKTASTKKKVELVVIQESPPNIATAKQWTRFDNWISLKNGQDQLPVTLTFTNSGFEALRIMLSGRNIATEKDFKDSTLAINVSNALGAGDSQIVIQGYGQPSSKVSWKLSTPRPVLSTVKPDTIACGQKLTLTGKNFLNVSGANVVTIGGKTAKIDTASAKQLVVVVPEDTPGGDQQVKVTVASIEAKPGKVKILPVAEVSAVDMFSAPPGYTITLSGKNFPAKTADISIQVMGVPAQVLSSTATSVQFLMPDIGEQISGRYPITVKVSGVQAKGNVNIVPGFRPIPFDGLRDDAAAGFGN